jgi:hypothetical protein
MTKGSIRILKPNVTQDEALRTFSKAGFSALYWRMRSGPLRRIADVYVPYFLFYVKRGNGRRRLFAMDAVDGSLDLFEFPRVPEGREVLAAPAGNRLPVSLSEAVAAELVREKALRIIFQQGFFKLGDARLEITPLPCELYLPYWLGFHERGGVVRCRAMDAVRRRIEGAKASAFFEHWLAA